MPDVLSPVPPYPLRFAPIFKEAIWGGRWLSKLGKALPAGRKIGESWEISNRPGSESRVANGPLAGQPLAELVRDYPEWLLGQNGVRKAVRHFPLLVKWISAETLLSVQVHPDERTARRLGAEPKTECWHVVDARPGAFLYCGLRRGASRTALGEAVRTGRFEEILKKVPVKPGETVYVPAGTVHAIGGGILLAEVQQNSDTTYRLHDWGRLGTDGKPRRTHVAEGLLSSRTDAGAGKRRSVSCRWFSLRRIDLRTSRTLRLDGGFGIVGGVEGTARVEAAGRAEMLRRGDWLLVPAAAGTVRITPRGRCAVLFVRAPSPRAR